MKRIGIVIFVLLLVLFSYLFIPETNVNYDMTIYLPDDASSKIGLNLLKDEFGEETMIQVLIMDIDISDYLQIQSELMNVSHVSNIIWLDDYVDQLELVPLDMIPDELEFAFYQDNDALITILFDLDTYSTLLEDSINDIKSILSDYDLSLRGEPLTHIESRQIANQETIKIMFLIVPLVVVLLVISSHSWFEPVLILLTLGIAVVFNLITNGLLPNVSFITQTMSLALQLALSIDYALFVIHRFYEERENLPRDEASKEAFKHSIKPITISAATTIAGFLALGLMEFSIGLDIALVLSKGILFSYLSTIILMPIFLHWFDSVIMKSKHRVFFPSFSFLSKIQYKFKYVFLGVLILCLGVGFYLQRNTNYLFGADSVGDKMSEVNQDLEYIESRFGPNHQLVVLVPNETIIQEVQLTNLLINHPHVLSVQTLVTEVDPNIPREFLLEDLVNYYVSEQHTRIIIQTDLYKENDALYQFVDEINVIIETQYDTYYLVGQSQALVDIKDSIESQGSWIMLITVLAVGLIVGLIFKSYKIPILLVSIILSAIWLNLSLLVIGDISVLYIGYLIVMSIQLGATIDYAVLYTHRYLEERQSFPKEQAMREAFRKSSISMMISGMILTVAGFVEALFSNLDSVTKIGLLLGRGALISLLMILIFLPVVLLIFDRWIIKEKRLS